MEGGGTSHSLLLGPSREIKCVSGYSDGASASSSDWRAVARWKKEWCDCLVKVGGVIWGCEVE